MSINWADRTGKPVFEVPKADGRGMRAVNKNDAMKNGWLGRTTSILKVIANWTIQEYQIEQVLKWAYSNKPQPEDSEDDYVRHGKAGGMNHAGERARRGTEIHEEMEQWLNGITELKGAATESTFEPTDHVAKNVVKSLLMLFEEIGPKEIVSEYNFARPDLGYAGTCDIYLVDNQDRIWIIDLKNTKTDGMSKPYESWIWQLGAYFLALSKPEEDRKPPVFAQLVFDQDSGDGWEFWLTPTGKYRKGSEDHVCYFNAGTEDNCLTVEIPGVYLYTQEESEGGVRKFEKMLGLWKDLIGYDPAEWEGGES